MVFQAGKHQLSLSPPDIIILILYYSKFAKKNNALPWSSVKHTCEYMRYGRALEMQKVIFNSIN